MHLQRRLKISFKARDLHCESLPLWSRVEQTHNLHTDQDERKEQGTDGGEWVEQKTPAVRCCFAAVYLKSLPNPEREEEAWEEDEEEGGQTPDRVILNVIFIDGMNVCADVKECWEDTNQQGFEKVLQNI